MKTLALYECLNKCMNEGKGDYFIYVNDHPVVDCDHLPIGLVLAVAPFYKDSSYDIPIPIKKMFDDVKFCYRYVTFYKEKEIDLNLHMKCDDGHVEYYEPASWRIDDEKKAVILEL